MSHPYDASYQPPFPSVEIALALRDEAPRVGPLSGLVDTGADGTFVAVEYIKRLATPVSGQTLVYPHFGSPRIAHTHTLDLLIGPLRLPALEVVGDDQGTEIILGRNALNKIILLLDGPRNQTDVYETRPVIRRKRGL